MRLVEKKGPKALPPVRDNGPGIPEEYRKNIYKVFFRLNRDRQPPGPSIIKAILSENNGGIWTGSPVGGRTVFHFTVPLEQ
ncbi:ATP-binding protein [Echinicola vietnamensis]|uniref:ATP-binding protein n=1 Tax=Echinicola vietnamensis TaxID=390884 RepID=UPI0012FCA91F|nr:sensor histidine kinase [Echinicola vietnamensis]